MNLSEPQTVECKQTWRDEYLKTICAFANTDGGEMWIGVLDDGNIFGVENPDVLIETLPNKINNRLGLLADVSSVILDGNKIVKIKVEKTYAPVNGKFYKRSVSNTIKLNGSNLTNFLLKKYGKTWDDIAEDRFSLSEIDLETIAKFKRLAQDRVPDIAKEKDFKTLLEKLNYFNQVTTRTL
jgi:ATP-dependent DNA helicase RecG